MARFQFRLATLLRLRELARDERRMQLAEALTLIDQLRVRSRQIDDLLRETHRLQAPPVGPLDADRLLNATRYELVLRAEQRALQLQEASLVSEVEKRRQALVAADRDVRSLELLREKQQERHAQEEEERGRKELDEIAVRRYAGEDTS
ncbi:MAG TPA: flagellar export protein FliJ [Pirellulales bacterium]|nr:flagellar export protein FliJ [Pirellulales bacterium]